MSYGIPPPAYRLPDATRLGAVRLQVSDLDQSDASLGTGETSRPLIHLHTSPGTRPSPRGARVGLYHFALLVPDRESLGRCLRHLAEAGVHVASADHAVSEALYLWDPDGLGIEVCADRPRESWTMAGQQIFMTSEPLDVRGLTAAGGAQPWTGMPGGTSLGHMHLQVDDLGVADAFYHRALGFDKTVWSFPRALFLSAGGYHHHLGTNTWAAGATRAHENEARLLEWEILVPSEQDQDQAAASCDAAGYRVLREDDARVVADPWNTTVRVLSRKS